MAEWAARIFVHPTRNLRLQNMAEKRKPAKNLQKPPADDQKEIETNFKSRAHHEHVIWVVESLWGS